MTHPKWSESTGNCPLICCPEFFQKIMVLWQNKTTGWQCQKGKECMCREGGSLGAVSVLGTLAGLPTSTLGSTAWPWHYKKTWVLLLKQEGLLPLVQHRKLVPRVLVSKFTLSKVSTEFRKGGRVFFVTMLPAHFQVRREVRDLILPSQKNE